ncbi:MAG TPA: hypothetical protein VN767_07915 [Streptosporangiaceae bacterium]|nr:hypothetical protein [Streptosporangiaceae bacterium]
MTDARASAGRRAAAGHLRELLAQPGRYRRRWEQHVVRSRPAEINQLAVAEVLARHLWSSPRVPGDEDVMARQLKDTVARALSGSLLSRSTLTLFIDAFGISGPHAGQLWRLWEGSGRVTVLSGQNAMGSKAAMDLREALGPRRHQTVSMHEHVDVGPDGHLVRTRTIQVVEATADGLDRIPYIYDTNALTLEVGQGCGEISGELYQISDGVYATTIPLARELSVGESISLEYETIWGCQGNLEEPNERQFRRAVMQRLENLNLSVTFHADKLPARVWWAVWASASGDIIEREQVPLSRHGVQRYLRSVEKTVVGFCWSWEGEAPTGGVAGASQA